MKPELSEVSTGLDRLATTEEIRTAISLFPERVILEADIKSLSDSGAFCEIASDMGGYVRIDLEQGISDLGLGIPAKNADY